MQSRRGQANEATDFYEAALGTACRFGLDEEGTDRPAMPAFCASHRRTTDLPDLTDFSPSAAVLIPLACDTASKVDRLAGARAAQADDACWRLPVWRPFRLKCGPFRRPVAGVVLGHSPLPGTLPG